MAREERTITKTDILPIADYMKIRKEKRAENVLRKNLRRLYVGPYATVVFENYDTVWMQIQEMLTIEKGGDEQLVDELRAYNPMIPNGSELTCTLMFEIDDAALRHRVLQQLGGVETCIRLEIGEHVIPAVSEQDVERTTAAGKTSSVHFLHFSLTPEAQRAFSNPDVPAAFVVTHPHYGHSARIQGAVRTELLQDLA